MSAAIYVTGLALIGLVSWLVAAPFFRGAREEAASPPVERSRWQKQKDDALTGIREAEFDFHLGKLSETDYRDMRARLEVRALEAMRVLEGKGSHGHDR